MRTAAAKRRGVAPTFNRADEVYFSRLSGAPNPVHHRHDRGIVSAWHLDSGKMSPRPCPPFNCWPRSDQCPIPYIAAPGRTRVMPMLLSTLSIIRWGDRCRRARLPVPIYCPLFSALTLLLFSSLNPAAAQQNSKQVLLLYSSEKDLPMNQLIDSQLRSAFRDKLSKSVDLYSEYHRFRSLLRTKEQPCSSTSSSCREKHSARGLDLVIVVEADTLRPKPSCTGTGSFRPLPSSSVA